VKKLEGSEGQKCGTSISGLRYVVSASVSNFTGQAFSYLHRLLHIFLSHTAIYCQMVKLLCGTWNHCRN